MNGPFNCPWFTFAAILVALGSVLGALIWSVFSRLEDE